MRADVLDHGYLEVIETWGSDERIIEAARMSTGKGFLGWGPAIQCEYCGEADDSRPCNATDTEQHKMGPHGPPGDEKLLAFLWNNRHATPFEMAGVTIEVQAPIFVFREWHRHRTQSYNEMSARYVPLPDVNYIPSVERLMIGSDGKNRQADTATGSASLDEEGARRYRERLADSYINAENLYQQALAMGVPKELARVHLPVGRYSRMRASANLRNWLAFLTLRSTAKNPAAQWEIRQYADAAHAALSVAFPRTLALFDGGTK